MNKFCTICQTGILLDEHTTKCTKCETEYHTQCWDENAGCAAYGCLNAPKVTKSEKQQINYNGKTCPFCKEEIVSSATICRFCKRHLPSDQAMDDEKPVIGENKSVIILFVLSLLGIFSPITLIWSLSYYFSTGKKMKQTNPLFRFLSLFSIVISTVFFILLIIILTSKSKG